MSVDQTIDLAEQPGITRPNARRAASNRRAVRRRRKRMAQRILLGLALCLLLLVVNQAIRLVVYGYMGYANTQALLELRRKNLPGGRLAVAAYPHVFALQRVATGVESELNFLSPLLQGARILPGVGETLAAVPRLLDAGAELATVGFEVTRLLATTGQAYPEAGIADLSALMIQENKASLPLLAERAVAARNAVEPIQVDALAGPLAERVPQLLAVTRLLEVSLHLGPELTNFLTGDTSYLLVAQNNHELRATGGFVSSVGELHMENGQFSPVQMQDSYEFARRDVDHPLAPDPLKRYMEIELIFLRDANWSPDFPTTAAVMRNLYALDTERNTGGVIAVDMNAVQRVVAALGSLDVEGAEIPVTGENVMQQFITFWESPLATGDTQESAGLGVWWEQRKDFMGLVAGAAMQRIQKGQFDPLALAQAVVDSLDAGSIQIGLAAPAAEQTLAQFRWDGRIAAPPQSDYLAVIDTNMGYNKVDAVLTRRLEYSVEWENGTPIATATLHYQHPVAMPNHVCDRAPRYGDRYMEMTERCYFNFVRVYAPQGSTLIRAEGVEPDSVAAARGPNQTQMMSGYFVMLPGESHEVSFVYELPASLFAQGYQLVLRKQAGTGPLPVRLQMGEQRVSTILEQTYLTWPSASITSSAVSAIRTEK